MSRRRWKCSLKNRKLIVYWVILTIWC